jgi:hypothetical protein
MIENGLDLDLTPHASEAGIFRQGNSFRPKPDYEVVGNVQFSSIFGRTLWMVDLSFEYLEILVDYAGVEKSRDVTVGIEDGTAASEIFNVVLERRCSCNTAFLKISAQRGGLLRAILYLLEPIAFLGANCGHKDCSNRLSESGILSPHFAFISFEVHSVSTFL